MLPIPKVGVGVNAGASGYGRRAALSFEVVKGAPGMRGNMGGSNSRPRRPLPHAPARRHPPTTARMVEGWENEESSESEGDAGGEPLSPEQDALPQRPQWGVELQTPRRKRFRDEDQLLSSGGRRGGAASGLLSLSRS